MENTVVTSAPIQGHMGFLVGLGSKWKKSLVICPITRLRSDLPASMPLYRRGQVVLIFPGVAVLHV